MLVALGVDAIHQDEIFPQDEKDTEWIPEIGRREYVLITWDRKTRTRPAEAEALRQYRVTTIYLGEFWKSTSFWSQATWFVRHWPRLEAFVQGCDPGTVAEWTHNGKFRYWTLGHRK